MELTTQKKILIIASAIGLMLITIIVSVGFQSFLGARVPTSDRTETIVGGKLTGSGFVAGKNTLEFRAKTTDGKILTDTVDFQMTRASTAPTPAPAFGTLSRVEIQSCNVVVDYTKNAPEACAHMYGATSGGLIHSQNVFCEPAGGHAVIPRSVFDSQHMQPGQSVKLCHGNNGGLCTEYTTITGGGSCQN